MPVRIGVVESIYYFSDEKRGPSIALSPKFSRLLSLPEGQVAEQPYQRKLKVGSEWTKLDHGWIEKASLLLIENDEGSHWGRGIPPEEERKEVMARVVEVAFVPKSKWIPDDKLETDLEPNYYVRPLECHHIEPADLSRIRIRCPAGSARITITLLPG